MSRSGYTDDCETIDLWRASVDRSIGGKRGQAFLRELAAAMDAMPEKVLIAEKLIDDEGATCAIGSVLRARGMSCDNIDYFDPETVGHVAGISKAMAAEIEFLNDEDGPRGETPAARWLRIRAWVECQLFQHQPGEVDTPTDTDR